MQDLAALIAAIEDAGYDWALAGFGQGQYAAAVKRHPYQYIGDAIEYSSEDGTTPCEALWHAAKKRGIVPE